MSHDPMCKFAGDKSVPWHLCAPCVLIREVRTDQREKDAQAIDDYAKETHQHVGGNVMFCNHHSGDRCDITAALRTAANKLRSAR